MEQDAIALADIVRLEPGNQGSDQLTELGGGDRSGGILGIDEDGLILVVGPGATEGKGQEVGVDVLVEEGVDGRHHGHGVPVPHGEGYAIEGLLCDGVVLNSTQ